MNIRQSHICHYFSKTEDQCSPAMKQADKEGSENNMHHHGTIKTILKHYLSNRRCSLHENVSHIFPELKPRRFFLVANTNLPEERVKVLLCEKERSELPDDR